MDYLKGLNDAQYEAVTYLHGPLMVLAGAGSGKTRVLTMRIAHLISNGIDPFSILALTFTNKAAKEMKARIAKVVGDSDAKSLWMGTFHSVFARILRSEAHYLGFPSNFTIYDTQDSLNVFKKVLKEMNIDTDTQWAYWDGVREFEAKNRAYLQGQIGNPEGEDKPNKKFYDPRVWLRKGEESLIARLQVAFNDLNALNSI